jgi:DNA-binding transcriptional regulator YiaG
MVNQEIKELRLKMDMSQEDFARLLGVKLQSVSRWELGKTLPGLRAKRELKKLISKGDKWKNQSSLKSRS